MSETMRPKTGDRVRLRLAEGRRDFRFGTTAFYAGKIGVVGRVDRDLTCAVTIEDESGERWVYFDEIEPVDPPKPVEVVPAALAEAILGIARANPRLTQRACAGELPAGPTGRLLLAARAAGVEIGPKSRPFVVSVSVEVDAMSDEEALRRGRELIRTAVPMVQAA